jgi:hypothetical protein
MADGHGKAMWSHTSVVLCLLANVNRNPKKQARPFRPSDFDPYHRKAPASKVPKVKLRSLKGSLFPGQKPKANTN